MQNTEAQNTQNTRRGIVVTETPIDPTFTVGAGATLARVASALKAEDRTTVNAGGVKVTANPVDLTVVDNITGATMDVRSTTTVGLDTTGVRFNRLGTKSLAALMLLRAGVTRETLSEDLTAALINDDVPAMAMLLGVDFDSTAWAEVSDLLSSLGEETRVEVAGRQQVSGYTTA